MSHTRHCGLGVEPGFMAAMVSHVEVFPELGRGTATRNSTRDTLARMLEQCGLTDATVVKTSVAAATIADVTLSLSSAADSLSSAYARQSSTSTTHTTNLPIPS